MVLRDEWRPQRGRDALLWRALAHFGLRLSSDVLSPTEVADILQIIEQVKDELLCLGQAAIARLIVTSVAAFLRGCRVDATQFGKKFGNALTPVGCVWQFAQAVDEYSVSIGGNMMMMRILHGHVSHSTGWWAGLVSHGRCCTSR
jgi:hypothetical protein